MLSDEVRRRFDTSGLSWVIQKTGEGETILVATARFYCLIAGERRWRSAVRLRWETIPALVRDDITVLDAKKLQLLENITRRDLNLVEEGRAYQAFLRDGLSIREIAGVVGKSANAIQWKVDMLRAREDVLSMVAKGQMTATLAWYIARLTPAMQDAVIPKVVTMPYTEACQYLEALFRQERQLDAFPETKVDERQVQTARKLRSALELACKALEEVGRHEEVAPGALAAALAAENPLMLTRLRELGRLIARTELAVSKRQAAAKAQETVRA